MIRVCAFLALLGAFVGCGRPKVERIEWPAMGTIAAVQVRSKALSLSPGLSPLNYRKRAQHSFAEVERLLNMHDSESWLNAVAPLAEDEILARCGKVKTDDPNLNVRACLDAAFKLMKASDGAFNPRWRGTNTLDLGAIAKGFAIDVAACSVYVDGNDALLDLGGNLKALRSEGGSHKPWKTGVKDPNGDGFAAVVKLREGEALATSATYYRGSHIYDGRTGKSVANGVASVTVLCDSAMWADGLSTTLFILGPEEGRSFLDAHLAELVGDRSVSALWILADGRKVTYERKPANFGIMPTL